MAEYQPTSGIIGNFEIVGSPEAEKAVVMSDDWITVEGSAAVIPPAEQYRRSFSAHWTCSARGRQGGARALVNELTWNLNSQVGGPE